MLGCCSRGSLLPLPRTCKPSLGNSFRAPSSSLLAPAQRHSHSQSPSTPRSAPLNTLSVEQKDILARALKGENVFVTGPSGSGKSYLLKIIAEQLKARKRPHLLTGGTPLSAFDIGGALLDSFTEGQTAGELETLQNRRRKDPASIKYRAKWQRIETIIIDDISRIDASLFDGLDKISRKMKNQKGWFGGIQIIASGDFFQLPPESVDIPAPDYAFNAAGWEPTFSTNQIELSQVFSQSEPEFVNMINQARIGQISPESAKLLSSLARPVSSPSIELCPLHVQAGMLTSSHLESLPGNTVQFWARDQKEMVEDKGVSRKLSVRDKEAYECVAPEVLRLKVGAQVICIQNLQHGRINIPKLALGTVTSFSTPGKATKLGSPYSWQDHRSNRVWPVVQFENGEKVMVVPVQFKFGGLNRIMDDMGSRTQVPLRLAAAGLLDEFPTSSCISRVKIDLAKRFPRGLAYTALSRAKHLDGLEVLNYAPGSLSPPERVISWYRKQPWARFLG
ncbi:hypothetical protein OPQ81_001229 [Rhizoctonia solani]|nr:hypothetical protein OPQ81_001229 [Rhizoctonia solani]